MLVKNEEFFHIRNKSARNGDWVVGNKFEWNSRDNLFLKNLFRMDMRMSTKRGKFSYRTAYESLLRLPDRDKNQLLFSYFDFTNFALNKTSMMLREVTLEQFRKENCPELPSRQKCIWVCQENAVQYWISSLQLKEVDVFQLKLNGVMHVASEKNLESDVFNVDQYVAMSKKYWMPDQQWSIDSEGIFDGEIEILAKR